AVWDLYKWYIAGGVTLFLVQTGLIVGLLASRAQRRRAQRSLAERLQFETLLSEVSAAFLILPTNAVDDEIERMLRRVGETLDFERAVLAERHARHALLDACRHRVRSDGVREGGPSMGRGASRPRRCRAGLATRRACGGGCDRSPGSCHTRRLLPRRGASPGGWCGRGSARVQSPARSAGVVRRSH